MPWRDPFQAPADPASRKAARRALLDAGLASVARLATGRERLFRLAALVEVAGSADPPRAAEALVPALAELEGHTASERTAEWAALVSAGAALLPEAGGPVLVQAIEARKADAASVGDGAVPLALAAALAPGKASLEEQVKLAAYLLSQSGRLRRHSERGELLLALVERAGEMESGVAAYFVDQAVQHAHIALEPGDRAPVRLAGARALARAGAKAKLDVELLMRLLGEAKDLEDPADRYAYVDALAAATGGLDAAEAARVLAAASAEAGRNPEPEYRRYGLQSVAVAQAELAARDGATHLEAARRTVSAIPEAGGDRVRALLLVARTVALVLPDAAAAILGETRADLSRVGDRRARSEILSVAIGVAARLPLEQARPFAQALREDATGAGISLPPGVYVELARLEEPRAREDLLGVAARAALELPDREEQAKALAGVLAAAGSLDPGGPERVLAAANGGEAGDALRRSLAAEARARARSRASLPGAATELLAAVEEALGVLPAESAQARLAELASSALEIPPLEAEVALVAILDRAPGGGDPLAVPVWAGDSFARLGSPQAARALDRALAALEGGAPAGADALANLARLVTMAHEDRADLAAGRLADFSVARAQENPAAGFETRLAVAAGYLAGDPRRRLDTIEGTLASLSDLPDRGRAVAGGLGEVAARLPGDILERLAAKIDDPDARLEFVLAAARRK